MTLDAIWKSPVTAAEEFDRTMAAGIAAAAAGEFTAQDVEQYWGQWGDVSEPEEPSSRRRGAGKEGKVARRGDGAVVVEFLKAKVRADLEKRVQDDGDEFDQTRARRGLIALSRPRRKLDPAEG